MYKKHKIWAGILQGISLKEIIDKNKNKDKDKVHLHKEVLIIIHGELKINLEKLWKKLHLKINIKIKCHLILSIWEIH